MKLYFLINVSQEDEKFRFDPVEPTNYLSTVAELYAASRSRYNDPFLHCPEIVSG